MKNVITITKLFWRNNKTRIMTAYAATMSVGAFVMGVKSGAKIEKEFSENPDMTTKEKALVVAKECGSAAVAEAIAVCATFASDNMARKQMASVAGYAAFLQDKIAQIKKGEDPEKEKEAFEEKKAEIILVDKDEHLYFDRWIKETFPITDNQWKLAEYAFLGKLERDKMITYREFYRLLGAEKYVLDDHLKMLDSFGWTHAQFENGAVFPFNVTKVDDIRVISPMGEYEPKLLYDSDGKISYDVLEEVFFDRLY